MGEATFRSRTDGTPAVRVAAARSAGAPERGGSWAAAQHPEPLPSSRAARGRHLARDQRGGGGGGGTGGFVGTHGVRGTPGSRRPGCSPAGTLPPYRVRRPRASRWLARRLQATRPRGGASALTRAGPRTTRSGPGHWPPPRRFARPPEARAGGAPRGLGAEPGGYLHSPLDEEWDPHCDGDEDSKGGAEGGRF